MIIFSRCVKRRKTPKISQNDDIPKKMAPTLQRTVAFRVILLLTLKIALPL